MPKAAATNLYSALAQWAAGLGLEVAPSVRGNLHGIVLAQGGPDLGFQAPIGAYFDELLVLVGGERTGSSDVDRQIAQIAEAVGVTAHSSLGALIGIGQTWIGDFLNVTAPTASSEWREDEEQTIRWTTNQTGPVTITISRDGGLPEPIDTADAEDLEYAWTVTGPASANCRIIVSHANAEGTSAAFTIEPAGEAAIENVVLLMLDDLGEENFPWMLPTNRTMPNVAAMAAAGTRFTSACANPLCTPTRVQYLTGYQNYKNYTNFGCMPPAEVPLSKVAHAAGVRVCMTGKWQFDDYDGTPPWHNQWGPVDDYMVFYLSTPPYYHRDPRYIHGQAYYKHQSTGAPTYITSEPLHGERMHVNYGLQMVQKYVAEDKPFLWIHNFNLPHQPWQKTPAHPSWNPDDATESGSYFPSMVEYADTMIGLILQQLVALGIEDRTLVLLMTDNGTDAGLTTVCSAGSVAGKKRSPLRWGTVVPLIAYCPGIVPAGNTLLAPVECSDLFATTLDALGVDLPDEESLPHGALDSKSLLPYILSGDEQDAIREIGILDWDGNLGGPEPTACAFAWNRVDANHGYKLYGVALTIGAEGNYREGQFYDWVADPFELTDLTGSETPEQLLIRADLEDALNSRGLTLTVTAPSTSQQVLEGDDLLVEWTTLLTGEVTIKLSRDGGSTFPTTLGTANAEDLEFLWEDVPLPAEADCMIRVEHAYDYGDSGLFEIVASSSEYLTITSPAPNTEFKWSDNLAVTWTTDATGPFKIEISDGVGGWAEIEDDATSGVAYGPIHVGGGRTAQVRVTAANGGSPVSDTESIRLVTVAVDDFTGSNYDPVNGRTAVFGGTWATISQVQIYNNTACVPVATTSKGGAIVGTKPANSCIAEITYPAGPHVNTGIALRGRHTPQKDYLLIQITALTSELRIMHIENDANVATLATVPYTEPASGTVQLACEISADGRYCRAYIIGSDPLVSVEYDAGEGNTVPFFATAGFTCGFRTTYTASASFPNYTGIDFVEFSESQLPT